MKYFVISDLHGNIDALVHLTEHWNEEEEKLLFIGDLSSRGPQSLPLMKFAMDCVKKDKAIWIKGNHELMFTRFMRNPMSHRDYLNPYIGGLDTLESFISDLMRNGYKAEELSDLVPLVNIISKEYSKLIEFINNLPLYHVDGKFAFVHAAIEVDRDNIQDVHEDTLLWGDKEFYNEEPHVMDKIIVFGHMPTQNLGSDGEVFVSFDKKKIGIDGGGFLETGDSSVNAISVNIKKPNLILAFNYNTKTKKVKKEEIDLT